MFQTYRTVRKNENLVNFQIALLTRYLNGMAFLSQIYQKMEEIKRISATWIWPSLPDGPLGPNILLTVHQMKSSMCS
jgi:hypothetical protein